MTFHPHSEQRGRSTPVESGYHPQFCYGGVCWSAVHTYIDADAVHPGQTVRAYLTFLSNLEYHLARIDVGMEFTVQEGSREIASGRVLGVPARGGASS